MLRFRWKLNTDSSRLASKRGGVVKTGLGLISLVAAVGALGWMFLLPSGIQSQLESRTGFPVQLETFSANPFGFSFEGTKLEIANPSDFGAGEPMLVVRSVSASGNPAALARGEALLDELTLDVRRLRLVRDERGNLNVQNFLDRLLGAEDGPMPFRAERVHLIVDEVEFVDYSSISPTSRSLRAMLDVELRNVSEPIDVFAPARELGQRIGALQ